LYSSLVRRLVDGLYGTTTEKIGTQRSNEMHKGVHYSYGYMGENALRIVV